MKGAAWSHSALSVHIVKLVLSKMATMQSDRSRHTKGKRISDV